MARKLRSEVLRAYNTPTICALNTFRKSPLFHSSPFAYSMRSLSNFLHKVNTLVVRPLQIWLTFRQFVAVILIRAYAFTGRRLSIGIIFVIGFLALLGAEIWLFGTQFQCMHLSPRKNCDLKPSSADVYILSYIIPQTGCFAKDSMIQWRFPYKVDRALRAGVSWHSFSHTLLFNDGFVSS
jgi:hypothetical protein